MTFSDRVKRRWIASVLFAIFGFLAVELLVWIVLVFVLFVALEMPAGSSRSLLIVIVEVLVGLSSMFAYAVRGMQNSSIDVLLRDAGPLERDIIAARIRQENGR